MAIAVQKSEHYPDQDCKAFQQIEKELLLCDRIPNIEQHLNNAKDKLLQGYEDIRRTKKAAEQEKRQREWNSTKARPCN